MKHLHSFAPKRLLAAAAAGVLSVCVLLPAGNVLAAETTTDSSSETFDDGTLTYKKLSNTTVSVTDCVESATHISIMPKIDGYDVVSIGEEAFANCTSLQGLTIPDTVTEIGSAAFYGCTALESLTVPDSVTKIESGTFFNCSALTDLTLGGKTTDIGDMAFGYCTSLETVALPDTVENMGNQVFYYCTALDDISIPDKVTELGSYTFYGCLALKSFEVPVNLEDIGAMSFVACPSLETITVADGNAKYTAVDNVLYDSEESILYLYPAGRSDTSFTLPDSTLVVYAGAFFAAGNLQQITFDEKLQYIGEMAFDFCSGLTSLNIPKGVTTIGTTAFADCTGLTSVTFDGASDEDGGDGDKLEIGDRFYLTVLGETLVYEVDQILTVTPDAVSSIHAEPDGDYVTLITCTPYGVNTHRLLVRGSRTTEPAAAEEKPQIKATEQVARSFGWKGYVLLGALGVFLLLLLLFAVRALVRRRKDARAGRKDG